MKRRNRPNEEELLALLEHALLVPDGKRGRAEQLAGLPRGRRAEQLDADPVVLLEVPDVPRQAHPLLPEPPRGRRQIHLLPALVHDRHRHPQPVPLHAATAKRWLLFVLWLQLLLW